MLVETILETGTTEFAIGQIAKKGSPTVLDQLTATGAYFVTEGRGRECPVVGKVFEVDGKTYLVPIKYVGEPEGKIGTLHLTSETKLITEEWNGRANTRESKSLDGKLAAVPEESRPAVISAINDAINAGYNLTRPGNRLQSRLNCLIG